VRKDWAQGSNDQSPTSVERPFEQCIPAPTGSRSRFRQLERGQIRRQLVHFPSGKSLLRFGQTVSAIQRPDDSPIPLIVALPELDDRGPGV
jgi:hypothetical protein